MRLGFGLGDMDGFSGLDGLGVLINLVDQIWF